MPGLTGPRAPPPFDAGRPPFAVPHDNYCDVVFPCGAVRDGGRWVVSMGVHDRWAELHALDAGEIERRLVNA